VNHVPKLRIVEAFTLLRDLKFPVTVMLLMLLLFNSIWFVRFSGFWFLIFWVFFMKMMNVMKMVMKMNKEEDEKNEKKLGVDSSLLATIDL
jgi:integral membrane sensor domain MASE1